MKHWIILSCDLTRYIASSGGFLLQHEYKEIVNWYNALAANYSRIVKYVESIGKSLEGRDIPAVHFTASTSPEYTVYFQCQIHASEPDLV